MANGRAKKDKLSEIALQPVEISVDLPENQNDKTKPGLKINRRFAKKGEDVFSTVTWDKRNTLISDEKGNVISQITDIEVPSFWTQLATDILAYKYFRKAGVPVKEGRETSAKQTVYRIAHTMADFGEKFGYFASNDDRQTFEDELTHLLLYQKAAFNSPVWFNCGLYHQYKIESVDGGFYWDFKEAKVLPTKNAYRNPQCSACFILSVKDTLPAIFDSLKTESHIFKYGSGAGGNFSTLRSKYERLSGGGTSSGMISFLRVFDRAAGATKSGGTTRRAAKMVVVNIDHPEIEDFIDWKMNEEKKAAVLIAAGYETNFNGDAYSTVSGQNANNSVRIPDEFMKAYEQDGEWQTKMKTSGETYKTYKARYLMDKIAHAAWQCADPGVQYDTTINEWHTCPNTDRINASNPCCVTGNTLIAVADGRNAVPIKDLVGTEVPVYAHDHAAKRTTVSRMWNIGVKRQNAPIYEVTLDDGSGFKATDDHLIMLRNGSYRMVKDLKSGDSLMPFHSKVLAPQKNRTKRRFFWSGQSWQIQYRAVWEYFFGHQPEGTHIHHQDFNALNDLLDNLTLMAAEDHNKLHGDMMRGDNNPARKHMTDAWRQHIAEAVRGEKNGNYGRTHSEETRELMRKASALRWSSPEEHERISAIRKELMTIAKAEGKQIGRHPGVRYEFCCPNCRQNFVTPREGQIYCSETCRYSELALHMTGQKTAAKNRGRALSEETKQKLSLSVSLASDPAVKREAALVAHRNLVLKAARLLLDHHEVLSLENWDTSRSTARGYGAARVPTKATVQKFFDNDEVLNEAAELYNHKVASVRFSGHEDVYDGTVDQHHNFAILTSVAASCVPGHQNYSGIFIHNSEYMFLDDSACNLASINLAKFVKDDGSFDVAGYRHACRIMFIGQEIAVDLSNYPTEPIAKNSHDYRPLGLGYANLGTMLMLRGVPYDSPEGIAIGGALTAIMTGHAYKASAEMAAVKGPFQGFLKNRAPMLNVMKKHRSAAYQINEKNCPTDLLEAARQDWDEAVALGEQFGYRNAQATVIAPTGTIGLLMDCDTTGVEPDFALIKFKKLAGGGSMKIVNNAVPKALSNLGYSDAEQRDIITYALGTGSLNEATPINKESLLAKGLTALEIAKLETVLPNSYDINHAFNRFILGDDVFTRLGVTAEVEASPTFSFLRQLGFNEAAINETNEKICGTQMLEGAPHLKKEHYPVFDCANKCGPKGTRFIEPMGHVRMMAAVQPFISGAISKTINMPNEATVEEVKDVYIQSWHLGLKALALYRDGSKLSQPLNSKRDAEEKDKEEGAVKVVYETRRRRMPDERQAITHKFSIAGHKGYLTVGLFDDGTPGEIFISMAKQGSMISGLMDAFALTISISLQYGVPLSIWVRKLINTHFEPYGFTTNPQIRIAKSLTDYIMRYLAIRFLPAEELEQLGIRVDNHTSPEQTSLDLPIAFTEQPVESATKVAEPAIEPDLVPVPDRQKEVQSDAPPCPTCGSMTTKTGTCYTCLSCGSTTGGCS